MGKHEIDKETIAQIGEELGIDGIGVTTAEPFHDVYEHLVMYRESGHESGFEHGVLEERVDPKTFFPEAKSIVAIAMAYRTEKYAGQKKPEGLRGQMSVYAWGMDYHKVLKQKLELLVARLEVEVGRPIVVHNSVDTGPLVDRAVAQRAGIGWVGKNCSLITEKHGSWVFLGQLVCDVDIEPNEPSLLPQCADCPDLCLKACPTKALVNPFQTDSSKCLSYITQMKGLIPEEYRAKLGRRLWGCDTCQVVCPKNKDVAFGTAIEFDPEPEFAFPDLMHLLELSNKQFRREFGESAAAWRGAKVMQRNAIIALGNMREKAALPKLLSMLQQDERPEIRGTIAWALRKIDAEGTCEAVAEAFERETEDEVKQEMAWAVKLREGGAEA
ncbi:tRNA epoxyqueuosine(34) reductase QueG [Tumebacillus algifaecis]|uniref:tRNA epoxyqueuosine(34) reductase QueG n=1 Tax=Tumebacillus algifaecis TaxID=1214604 RepID=A0A223CZG0_9BACL|nr:tRNA epoxyqueuosine(34) reductase QueG [Tumebacillus algifaecis]ASS74467.1 tRNA epoxyqueuosine(34) reductase QueG [Tumebacillus algifaecis]